MNKIVVPEKFFHHSATCHLFWPRQCLSCTIWQRRHLHHVVPLVLQHRCPRWVSRCSTSTKWSLSIKWMREQGDRKPQHVCQNSACHLLFMNPLRMGDASKSGNHLCHRCFSQLTQRT